jgi:hypothetical protein
MPNIALFADNRTISLSQKASYYAHVEHATLWIGWQAPGGRSMIVGGILQLPKRTARLFVMCTAMSYEPVRNPVRGLAWTLEQNEILLQALGVQGE